MPVQPPWSLRKVNEVSTEHYQPIFRTVTPLPEDIHPLTIPIRQRAATAGTRYNVRSIDGRRRALLYPAKLKRLERAEILEVEKEEEMLHEFTGLNPSQRKILLHIVNRPSTAPAYLSSQPSSRRSSESLLSDFETLPIERVESYDSSMSFPVEEEEVVGAGVRKGMILTEDEDVRRGEGVEGRGSCLDNMRLLDEGND
ncbi:hypothetical protein HK097_002484 [Rhizophlyctis rosea]|uniref:Uncharacterized protein n=1 Tax=Rhizophlyctis rosea TaxID=64517 RepID=A0AAD5X440_9FUNG|nr:hypothetical protein HK097_002484 [Rhizophlyctis rosea]